MTGRPGRQQERCALTPAGSAGFASKRRTDRWSHREQRDHRTAGIASRREPGLSFIHSARMVRPYGKCRLKLLCFNCHRMIHSKRPCLRLEDLALALTNQSSVYKAT